MGSPATALKSKGTGARSTGRRGVVAVEGEGSITRWIGPLKAGDEAAAQEFWQRYFATLMGLARERLKGARPGPADEEDVALSALNSFFAGAAAGRFPRLEDRDDLWRVLVTITARKAI